MKIRFLGPLGRVTGSCTWLRDEAHGWNLLVDCGLRQGERDDDAWNRAPWPFKPEEITAVILTHAHLDHCGLLPALYRRYAAGQPRHFGPLLWRVRRRHGEKGRHGGQWVHDHEQGAGSQKDVFGQAHIEQGAKMASVMP